MSLVTFEFDYHNDPNYNIVFTFHTEHGKMEHLIYYPTNYPLKFWHDLIENVIKDQKIILETWDKCQSVTRFTLDTIYVEPFVAAIREVLAHSDFARVV